MTVGKNIFLFAISFLTVSAFAAELPDLPLKPPWLFYDDANSRTCRVCGQKSLAACASAQEDTLHYYQPVALQADLPPQLIRLSPGDHLLITGITKTERAPLTRSSRYFQTEEPQISKDEEVYEYKIDEIKTLDSPLIIEGLLSEACEVSFFEKANIILKEGTKYYCLSVKTPGSDRFSKSFFVTETGIAFNTIYHYFTNSAEVYLGQVRFVKLE